MRADNRQRHQQEKKADRRSLGLVTVLGVCVFLVLVHRSGRLGVTDLADNLEGGVPCVGCDSAAPALKSPSTIAARSLRGA